MRLPGRWRYILLALLLPLLCQAADDRDAAARLRLLNDSHRIHLTPQELRWISEHPTVNVVSVESYAPASYIDRAMNYRGISADLLTLIRIRTGLAFSVYDVKDLKTIAADIHSGKAQLAAGIPLGSLPEVSYSPPWLSSKYVLLTSTSRQAPQSLGAMSDLVVAVRGGSLVERLVALNYPDVRQIKVNSLADAVDLLLAGQVDAAVGTQANAEYQLAREGRKGVKIASTLDLPPLSLAFAVSPAQPELLTIVNKVMASLPENDLQLLGSSWRFQGDEFWSTWRQRLLQILVLSGIIIVLSLGWGISLRRQVRQRAVIQRALNNQLTFIYAMMDAMPYPVVLRDLNGELIGCNSRYLEEVNLTRDEVTGHRITELPIAHEMAAAIHQDYQQVIRSGKPLMTDRALYFLHMEKPRMVSQWIVPFYDSEGNISGVYSGWVDITERQALLQQLHESSERAEAANRAKTTFLSTMSHEIRTPLNAIIGILELQIKQNSASQQPQPMLDVAHDAAKNLLDVVGDILDIARIESGRMTIEPQQAELIALTRSVVRIFESVAAQKHLSLTLSISGDKRRLLMIEPLRYKQILSNLLSNAIKFTSQGGVRVTLAHSLAASGLVEVWLTVADSGIGISEQDQQQLFQPFSQLAGNGQTARQGTGLGLSICRTLCEMMHGEVTLESTPGEGTTVRVLLRLPLAGEDAQAASAELPAEQPLTFRQKQILIVDDYLPNRILLRHQLQFLGHLVMEAEHGEQALAMWREGHHYDAMLIDCNMPVMDGLTLARTIREEARQQGQPPLLMLGFTADAQPEMVERCLAAGMDGCLFKPTTLDELAQWLQIQQHVAPDSAAPPPLLLSGQQLLDNIASLTGADSALNQTFLQQLLQSLQENRQLLQQALAAQQPQIISDEAHKIKGLARLVQSDELHAQCTALEQACQLEAWPAVAPLTEQLLARLQLLDNATVAALAINAPVNAPLSP